MFGGRKFLIFLCSLHVCPIPSKVLLLDFIAGQRLSTLYLLPPRA